eukprot:5247923-Pyramimonas_sp.AAC.1
MSVGLPKTRGYSANCFAAAAAGNVASQSAGVSAISSFPSAGTWKFTTHAISAGCPAMASEYLLEQPAG